MKPALVDIEGPISRQQMATLTRYLDLSLSERAVKRELVRQRDRETAAAEHDQLQRVMWHLAVTRINRSAA